MSGVSATVEGAISVATRNPIPKSRLMFIAPLASSSFHSKVGNNPTLLASIQKIGASNQDNNFLQVLLFCLGEGLKLYGNPNQLLLYILPLIF